MEREHTLTERIVQRFEQHRQNLAGKQQQLDSRMKELLDQRERLDTVAKGKIEKIVLPCMEELARQFDNAEIEVLHSDAGYNCVCKFSHTRALSNGMDEHSISALNTVKKPSSRNKR